MLYLFAKVILVFISETDQLSAAKTYNKPVFDVKSCTNHKILRIFLAQKPGQWIRLKPLRNPQQQLHCKSLTSG